MILLILLGLTFFIQLLAAPWFVMVETAGSNGKLLKYRLLCMGIFIADTLLCGAIAKAHTHVYFILIGVGMVASFIAGILITKLKNNGEKSFFVLQSVTNLLYASAFIYQLHTLFQVKNQEFISTIIPLIIAILLIPFMCRKNGKLQPISILSVLSTLFVWSKAAHLGVLCQQTSLPMMQAISFTLIMGSSALGFSLLLSTRQRISSPPQGKPQLPKHCMYFFGQMLIACSILICGGLR